MLSLGRKFPKRAGFVKIVSPMKTLVAPWILTLSDDGEFLMARVACACGMNRLCEKFDRTNEGVARTVHVVMPVDRHDAT